MNNIKNWICKYTVTWVNFNWVTLTIFNWIIFTMKMDLFLINLVLSGLVERLYWPSKYHFKMKEKNVYIFISPSRFQKSLVHNNFPTWFYLNPNHLNS